MTRPRVAVVTTGGTIDSVGTDRLDLTAYLDTGNRLPPGELLTGIAPELATVADVREVPFRRLRAHAMTDADLADLVDLVRSLLEHDEADGVVVTHGTNTLEETAWLLHLVVASERPIVLTGAMRPASALSGDGPLNMVNAVRLAASDAAHGLGTLVLLDDTIHGARGIVCAGTGAGYPTPGEVEALERASAAGVAVIQATRVAAGRVPAIASLVSRGWVAVGDLNPWKARILLRLALAAGITGREELQALLDEA